MKVQVWSWLDDCLRCKCGLEGEIQKIKKYVEIINITSFIIENVTKNINCNIKNV